MDKKQEIAELLRQSSESQINIMDLYYLLYAYARDDKELFFRQIEKMKDKLSDGSNKL